MRRWSTWASFVLLAACKFPELPPIDEDSGTRVDAAPECEPDQAQCSGEALTVCGPDGRFVRYDVPNGGPLGEPVSITLDGYPCPLGCHATEARCNDVAPSNGLTRALDTADVGLSGVDVLLDDTSGDIIVSTNAGAPNGEIVIVEPGGDEIAVPAEVITQVDGPDIVVLKVRTFTVREGVHLKLAGTKAIAIVSHLDVYIAGHVNLSGTNVGAGASQNSTCNVALAPGPGGGGGNYGRGGDASNGSAGGANLEVLQPGLIPLQGGCSNYLGVGGGAIQIVSRTKIALSPNGLINVSGRQGSGLVSGGTLYAFGGGSGGGVVLEAPSIVFALGSRVAGRGGGGAAANATNNTHAAGTAGDADLSATSIPGGMCTGCGTGGSGGTESTPPGSGSGISGTTLAGGGGAVGRCVAANRSGVLLPPSGTMKIRFTSRAIAAR